MKNRSLIAAIDAGTTGTRCCIFDETGSVVASSYHPLRVFYPTPGWVEQDPGEVIDATLKVVAEAAAFVDRRQIAGLCFSIQRNSFAAVDGNGNFLTNVITWQDQRGEKVHPWILDRLKSNGISLQEFYQKTGQPFGSFQCGYKALWYRVFREDLYRKTYRLLTPHAYLLQTFGIDGYIEENKNRGFWLLADADTQEIDEELCRVFDFRSELFPDAVSPGTLVGTVSRQAAAKCGLLEGTPIYSGCGDQNCGMLGAGNYGTTEIVSLCMGTAGLCIAYSPDPIRHPKGLCQVQGHPASGYIIETHSSSCTSSYRWAEDQLFSNTGGLSDRHGVHPLTESAQQAPAGSNGVLFLPWLQGASCPHYDDAARGAYIGMSLANRKSDLCRATMEGISFENKMMLETLQEALTAPIRALRVIGGASNDSFWSQMQADIYGLPVETITAKESAALGAAIIGAVASGIYSNYKEASQHMTHVLQRFLPNKDNGSVYSRIYKLWDNCYSGLSQTVFPGIFEYQSGLHME